MNSVDCKGANYRNADLRGVKFSGDCRDVDFSYADLRGANFSKANLQGSCFVGARLGLTAKQKIITLLVVIVFSIVAATLSGIAGVFAHFPLGLEHDEILWPGLGCALTLAILSRSYLINGFKFTWAVVVLCFFVPGTVGWLSVRFDPTPISHMFVSMAWFSSGFSFNLFFTATACIVLAIIFANRRWYWITPLVQMIASIAIIVSTASVVDDLKDPLYFSLAIIIASIPLGTYIAHQAKEKLDERYQLIIDLALNYAARGTNFSHANLDGATFSNFNDGIIVSHLVGTDCRKPSELPDGEVLVGTDLLCANFADASIRQVCWYACRNHHFAHFKNTYMSHLNVRLLATLESSNVKNYDNTRKLNQIFLQGVDLSGFSFVDADLEYANLSGANLKNVFFVSTKLSNTDLRGADITGSCIENWIITANTKMDNIKCDYIYENCRVDRQSKNIVKLDKINRLPQRSSETFSVDGFFHYMKNKVMSDALKFYHQGGQFNQEAHSQSFNRLRAENDDYQFEVTSVSRFSANEVIVEVRSELPLRDEDKSRFHEQYFSQYQLLLEQLHQRVISDTEKVIDDKLKGSISEPTFSAGIMDGIRCILIFIHLNAYKTLEELSLDLAVDRGCLIDFLSKKTKTLQGKTRQKFIDNTPDVCRAVYAQTKSEYLADFDNLNKTLYRKKLIDVGKILFSEGYHQLH